MVAGEVEEKLDFSDLLGADFWKYKLHFSHVLNQNPTLFQPVGGMDAIVRAFAGRVGDLAAVTLEDDAAHPRPAAGMKVGVVATHVVHQVISQAV